MVSGHRTTSKKWSIGRLPSNAQHLVLFVLSPVAAASSARENHGLWSWFQGWATRPQAMGGLVDDPVSSG